MLDLVGNPEDMFSHNEAHILIIARQCYINDTKKDIKENSMISSTSRTPRNHVAFTFNG